MKGILKLGMSRVTGKMIYVAYASNGESCNCICAECGETLIARQGESKEWHFAHKSGKLCIYAPETALHWLSKQIVAEENSIKLPNGNSFLYTQCLQEAWMPGIRPDIKISNGAETMLVEIVVTNKISKAKRVKLQESNLSVLVIDLSDVERMIMREDLRKIVIDDCSRKTIIKNTTVTKDQEDNRLLNIFLAILAALAFWAIVRLIKHYSKRRRKYQYSI